MVRLFCEERYCIHRNILTGECEYSNPIYVDDFYEYGSEDTPCFESVSDLPEYKSEYWQACKSNTTGYHFKRKRYGKRCEENGVVFYTELPLPAREYWPDMKLEIECTEEKTGLKFTLYQLYDEKSLAAIREIRNKAALVAELPEYEELEEALK